MSVDETKVLIGGRRFRKISQTKVFVEKEDSRLDNLRHRNIGKPTPGSKPQYPSTHSDSLANHSPPHYGNQNYLTPPPLSKSPYSRSMYDSGYYPSPNRTDTSTPRSATKPSVWDMVSSSPAVSLGNKFRRRGRANFFDDDRAGNWSFNPQKFLGGLVFVTIVSSIGFAVLISMKHFGEDDVTFSNGKYQSLKFAAEKIQSAADDEESSGRIIENKRNPFFSDDNQYVEEHLFGVMNEIGKMDDLLLAEKISSDEMKMLMKDSKIRIQKLSDEKPGEAVILNVDDISEELLTTAPPSQAFLDNDKAKIVKPSEDPSQGIPSNEGIKEPACCPHKPEESKQRRQPILDLTTPLIFLRQGCRLNSSTH